jgi:hypothetical protein
VACPNEVVRLPSECMTGPCATLGVAGAVAPDGGADIDAKEGPLKFFMTAGQVSGYISAAALLSSMPGAERLIADRGYDAD